MGDTNNLNNNTVDYTVAVLKGCIGIVPFAGQALGELVARIPGQRFDRFQKFLQILDERLKSVEQPIEELKNKMSRDGFFELYEEACEQATRINSDDRRRYIAGVIAKGLSEEQIELLESRQLLRILGALNDSEILILRLFWNPIMNADEEFRDKHQHIIFRPTVHSGSSQEEFDKSALYDSYIKHLVSLGLLEPKYKEETEKILCMEGSTVKEKNKRVKTNEVARHDITPLGRLFLYHIEIVDSRMFYMS